jgi:sulfoxide reductase catalytic subunit YedY
MRYAGFIVIAGAFYPKACTSNPLGNNDYTQTDEKLTPFDLVTNFNSFFEFSPLKVGLGELSKNFSTSPWEVEITGLVKKPGTIDINDIKSQYQQEERVYRLRCVEGWSMVIPWLGFPLASLLKDVEPLPEANFVKFTTVYRPSEMPGQKNDLYKWPYVEGLRLDEAMHNLTILTTGLYQKDLLPQSGAPIRLVVPWKYGYKSIKSIVKIELVKEMPKSFWMDSAPNEYGFYANVNPNVPHPHWSQASEQRIGEDGRRETLMFNGYQDEVESMYEDMDLKEFF